VGKISAKIFDLEGKSKGKLSLPPVFKTSLRPDVIKRAVLAIQSHRFQPQGRDPMAGKRTTAESLGVGRGIARVARIKGRGQRAALIPFAVGGRRTHPPVVEKKIRKKIPRKEMKLALRSAVAATASKETVSSRGHMTDDVPDFPLVVVDEIQRRAGKGKRRGRKMKQAVGPLLVISENKGVVEAARNLPGVDIVNVNNLNVELLAPGTHPGRLTVWTNSAFEKLNAMFGEG
jgi:large subunit ribosomal protein L4e